MPETSSETMENEATATRTAPNKPPEAGTSISGQANTSVTAEEQEQSAIVQTMDADTSNVLRQRRIAFYDHRHDTLIGNASPRKVNFKKEVEFKYFRSIW